MSHDRQGTGVHGAPWFVSVGGARFELVRVETQGALGNLRDVWLKPDQARELADALLELADVIEGDVHTPRVQLQQQLDEQEQQIDQLASDIWQALTPTQCDAAFEVPGV
jgi:hypothetical protein